MSCPGFLPSPTTSHRAFISLIFLGFSLHIPRQFTVHHTNRCLNLKLFTVLTKWKNSFFVSAGNLELQKKKKKKKCGNSGTKARGKWVHPQGVATKQWSLTHVFLTKGKEKLSGAWRKTKEKGNYQTLWITMTWHDTVNDSSHDSAMCRTDKVRQ